MKKPTIWVIDDDVALRVILDDTLTEAGYDVKTFGQARLAWQTLETLDDSEASPQTIITDIRMPMMDGLTFSEKLHGQFPQIPVIIMTAHADVQSAVDSYQTGAFDYLPKPFELEDAVTMVQKALRQFHQNHAKNLEKNQENQKFNQNSPSAEQVSTRLSASQNPKGVSGIIGQSVAMQQVFRAIGRLSNTPITVLITGESGTGKELIAHALHEHSPRKHKPFIALNMAAIPHELIESELFGHEKGAFTGASNARIGRFEQAHGGTLFLDEIGDMPLPTQTRLLRVLANGEFFRVGGQKPIHVDVRIIAATHQNLENLIKQGKFREDLFYRLNVIRLTLPALRERREDIPLLVDFFMQTTANSMQMPIKTIAPATMQVLQAFNWQGNVRQLENTCRWLTVMASGQQVQIDDLPPEILAFYQHQQPEQPAKTPPTFNAALINDALTLQHTKNLPPVSPSVLTAPGLTPPGLTAPGLTEPSLTALGLTNGTFVDHDNDWLTPLAYWAKNALQQGQPQILHNAMLDFERCLLQVTLEHTNHHKGKAAELLGWGRNTVTRKFQQLLENSDNG